MLTPEQIKTFKENLLQWLSNWKLVGPLKGIDYVRYGVWDITGIEFISIDIQFKQTEWRNIRRTPEEIIEHTEKIMEFIERFPDCVIADAYQTENPFLLAHKPTNTINYIWSWFNRWANNIIENCPQTILIVAEDD